MQQKPPVVLSIRQASKVLRKAELHFRKSVPMSFSPECYGEYGEPLYCADAMMNHLVLLLDDITRETFEKCI